MTADITAGEVRSGIPGAVAQHAAGSGLLNERAPLQMADALDRRAGSLLSDGRFRLVLGARSRVLRAAGGVAAMKYPESRACRFSMPSAWNLHRAITRARWFAV